MQYAAMIETVQHRLQVTHGEAESVLAGTVQALAETSRGGEMRDLQAQLPEPLASITPAGSATGRGVDEFCARVADLSTVTDPHEARTAVQTVLAVLTEAVTEGQLHQLVDTLPGGYAQLLPSTHGLDPSAEVFVERVRVRADLPDTEQALTVTRAVLATLAERIHQGQADDLLASVPTELHPDRPGSDAAQPTFDRDTFLAKVVEQTPASNTAQAQTCTRAVLATLLDQAPDQIDQTRDQLPRGLADLIDLDQHPAQHSIP